ncbi:MAG: sigma 54-interacting transcriptional regulator, partial [Planctomycetota bacterium]|nr:sigma 54-interacting transcriptional regulator [Planctomycetota bacterium]
TGEAIQIADIEKDPKWIARPDWARKEGIRGFGGQPLVHQGCVLGVLAVFTRVPLADEAFLWHRLIADHAAVAIANARAFVEIEGLKAQLELECDYLREEVSEAQAFGEIVGQSPALRNLLRQIELVAPTVASGLVLGESGTGKELVAREINKRSARAKRPLIRVNCASIPRELYESEFFGHVQGAFTGATKDRAGRFEAAHGGTLFLDEVGEIPLDLQSKLLRVLQEGQYERVGEEKTREVDVRVIAATNTDLKSAVEAARFRQDLYYRLNVFPVEVAPLRERAEDIPLLAAHFVDRLAQKLNKPRPRLTRASVMRLQAYDWPGNVRELQNVIERGLITSRAGVLTLDLPEGEARAGTSVPDDATEVVPDAEMRRRERANTLAALEMTGWRISGSDGAAALLGLKPTTLASRLKKLGLRRK